MYRIWIEEGLGFHLRDQLNLRPTIPDDWPGFDITYRYRSATYQITVQKDPWLDVPTPEFLHLVDDGGFHRVTVRVPRKAASTCSPLTAESTTDPRRNRRKEIIQ